jgi:hypothetical protein
MCADAVVVVPRLASVLAAPGLCVLHCSGRPSDIARGCARRLADHESLVHPAMAARLALAPPSAVAAAAAAAPPSTAAAPLRVLLLGAGDGLAAREVLAYGERVASIDLVDLDPHITSLFQEGSDRAVPGLVAL